ncbi:hypothetical protein BTH42_03250 [Burkholderia sp. SRS-W-2-2016]|uniref:hypothetical protein n=1 Tax=Burkholderia sp. SRS-W-2-2016 TaxID=1926878 RepID=UPI00094AA6A2|nr:hypothetical protein [Burkholderia sp. SRS-W-2-2016]OLL32972.1 hypothetical protein BTH42_03250 [Burkholderia sp. SRS-W-2-2016]
MAFKTYTVLTLLATSSAAFAWQPLTYPMRSQSPYERGVDSALCYAEASRVSKVNIVREPQIPARPAPAAKGASTGAPAKPPLPPSTFSATPLPYAASMPDGASAPMAGAPDGASAVKPANEAVAGAGAGGKNNAAIAAASGASGAAPATTASAAPGASGAADTSLQANAGSGVSLPPLPAPEPPMTRYWAAYGACMQARGYAVQ